MIHPYIWADYGLFVAKTLSLVFLVVAGLLVVLRSRRRGPSALIEVESINRRFARYKSLMAATTGSKKQAKQFHRDEKQNAKKRKEQPRLFVLDFEGDIKASGAQALSKEISAVISAAEAGDEVLLRLTSPGGTIPGYGLAASELTRLGAHDVKLTIAIDKVAASGGYMMACVADHILAAPFGIVGSIGVVAGLPNFNRFLKEKGIDFEQHTAGKYKRTLSMFGEIEEEGREKFKEELAEAHELFKDWIKTGRPALDIEKLATGEYWYGKKALEMGLIDEIGTSEDYLLKRADSWALFQVKQRPPKSPFGRLGRLKTQLTEALAPATTL